MIEVPSEPAVARKAGQSSKTTVEVLLLVDELFLLSVLESFLVWLLVPVVSFLV